MLDTGFAEHYYSRTFMNNGKKKGRGRRAPALTLRVLAMSLAQSGSTFESLQLDEIQDGLKELLRCEIQNSTAMLEVCWD
jgi:hypothetical protein